MSDEQGGEEPVAVARRRLIEFGKHLIETREKSTGGYGSALADIYDFADSFVAAEKAFVADLGVVLKALQAKEQRS